MRSQHCVIAHGTELWRISSRTFNCRTDDWMQELLTPDLFHPNADPMSARPCVPLFFGQQTGKEESGEKQMNRGWWERGVWWEEGRRVENRGGDGGW